MDNSFSERTFLSKLCDRGCPSWGICHCTGTSTSAKVGPIYHLVKVHPLSSFCLGFGHPFTPKAPSWSKWGWWSICSQQVACLFWNWGLSLCLGRPSQVRIVCARSEPWIKIICVSNVFIHLVECNLLLGLVKALQGCLWFSRIILQITQNLQRNSKQDKFSHSCFLFPA